MALVYIAHQLTGGNKLSPSKQKSNFREYMRWVYRAMKEGHTVISWAHHFIVENEFKLALDYDQWMEHCYQLVESCDELWVGSDPSQSTGVQLEIDHAIKLGKKVAYKYIENQLALCPFCGSHVVVCAGPITNNLSTTYLKCRQLNCPLNNGVLFTTDHESIIQQWNNRLVRTGEVLSTTPVYLTPKTLLPSSRQETILVQGQLTDSEGNEIP